MHVVWSATSGGRRQICHILVKVYVCGDLDEKGLKEKGRDGRGRGGGMLRVTAARLTPPRQFAHCQIENDQGRIADQTCASRNRRFE